MGFRLDLVTFPVQRGEAGDPSSWGGGGTSTSVVSASGDYDGTEDATYTFTVVTGGTVGTNSLVLTWSNTLGDGGRLDIPVTYTAGEAYYFHAGLSVAFAAGTVVASETFTVAAYAAMRHPRDARFLNADPTPGVDGTSVLLTEAVREPNDVSMQAFSGRIFRLPSVIKRNPNILIDYLDDEEKAVMDSVETGRNRIALGENYNLDTVFLLRGGGIHPLIGANLAFTRSNPGPYLDARTGLWRLTGGGVTGVDDDLRVFAGPAFSLAPQGAVNYNTRFHPSGASTAAERGWDTHAGTPVFAFDTNTPGVLDPDGGWAAKFLKGTLRVDLDATEAIRTTDEPASVSGTHYPNVFYIAGRGAVTVALYNGAASPTTLLDSDTISLDSMAWQRVELKADATTSGPRHLRITATSKAVIWLSACSMGSGYGIPDIIQSDGTVGAVSSERALLQRFTLPQSGTLSMWVKLSDDDYSGQPNFTPLFEETSAGNFYVRYTENGTDRVDVGLGGTAVPGNVTLAKGVWNNVVVTWQFWPTGSNAFVTIYVNGSSVGSGTQAWAHPPTSGATYDIGRSASTYDANQGALFKEVRIDRRVWSASEALEQYQRFTLDEWTHHMTEYAGRGMEISGSSFRAAARSAVNPHLLEGSYSLREARVHPDSLMVSR